MSGALPTLTLALVALGSGQHPHAQAPAAPPAKGIEVSVHVQHVAPSGERSPVADREVILEAWTRPPGRGTQEDLSLSWAGRTGASGEVRFSDVVLPRGAEVVASVVHEGVTFRGLPPASGGARAPIGVTLYDVTADRTGLVGSAQVNLSVRDAFVIVELSMGLQAEGEGARRVIDLSLGDGPARMKERGEGGLLFPLPLPALFGQAVPQGLLPPETSARHMATRDTPATGRFVFAEGGMWYSGPVMPGTGITLQARYALPIAAERQLVALRSPIPLEPVVALLEHSDRVAPRMVPSHAYVAISRRSGEELRTILRLDEPLPAGEDLVLTLEGLPRPGQVYQRAATAGAIVLLAAFLLAVAVGRRRAGGGHARGA